MDELFSVADQVVLVSGGSRGIGKAIAQGFANRGAKVAVTGRDADTLEQTVAQIEQSGTSHPVMPVVCDVSDSEAIRRAVASVAETFGRIDTLVNVAGVNRRKPSVDVSDDDYDFVMDINMRGAFFMCRDVGKVMLEQGSGSQINVSSLNNDRPLKNVLPYASSKAAMGHMTRALAMEWGPMGIRVNALAPGFVLTDLTYKLWSDPGMQQWGDANTPLRRLGQPDDMIGTAIFLASSASAFMTGQILYVDGGFTAGWAWPIPEGGGQ